MKKRKYTTSRKKVNRKILLFAFVLLCITLLRSQTRSFWNLALTSNQSCGAAENILHGDEVFNPDKLAVNSRPADSNQLYRAADNTQSSSQPLFSLAAGRFHAAGLQLANNQPEYAVGYTLHIPISVTAGGSPPATGHSDVDWLDELIEKIWFVESTNRLNPPDGDGGNAVGPLQIHQCVLRDVNERYGTNFVRKDLRKLETARIVARLYISMWMEGHKEEIAARIFNGGPRGWRKKSTDTYWERIQKSEFRGK